MLKASIATLALGVSANTVISLFPDNSNIYSRCGGTAAEVSLMTPGECKEDAASTDGTYVGGSTMYEGCTLKFYTSTDCSGDLAAAGTYVSSLQHALRLPNPFVAPDSNDYDICFLASSSTALTTPVGFQCTLGANDTSTPFTVVQSFSDGLCRTPTAVNTVVGPYCSNLQGDEGTGSIQYNGCQTTFYEGQDCTGQQGTSTVTLATGLDEAIADKHWPHNDRTCRRGTISATILCLPFSEQPPSSGSNSGSGSMSGSGGSGSSATPEMVTVVTVETTITFNSNFTSDMIPAATTDLANAAGAGVDAEDITMTIQAPARRRRVEGDVVVDVVIKVADETAADTLVNDFVATPPVFSTLAAEYPDAGVDQPTVATFTKETEQVPAADDGSNPSSAPVVAGSLVMAILALF